MIRSIFNMRLEENMTSFRTFIAALAILLTGACAPASNGLDTSTLPAEEKATVQVRNYNLNPVTVYLVRSGMRHRIGRLGTHQTKTFEVPRDMIRVVDDVRLVADPVGPATEFTASRTMPFRTEPLRVPEGQDIVFTIENNLAASTYTLASL
jgi:hypothetical protein